MVYLPQRSILNSSRSRKIKCDIVQPVCGPCSKNGRQCGGPGYTRRLIIRDETEKWINKFSNGQLKCRTIGVPEIEQVSNDITVEKGLRSVQNSDTQTATLFCPISNIRLYNAHEQLGLLVFCCKKTLTLRTFTWVMSETKWSEMIPKTMEKSQALTCTLRANAANHLAKEAGAVATPHQALTQYASALSFLQRDLYHPVKQRSDETLFTVLLLGLFDV